MLLLDAPINTSYGLEYGSLDAQDEFGLDSQGELYDKWDLVKQHLGRANAGSRATIYINYLSGATDTDTGDGQPIPVVISPYFVASGHSRPDTDAPRLWTGKIDPPSDSYPDFPRLDCVNVPVIGRHCSIYYEGTNVLTLDWIGNRRIAFSGIVMADFPGNGLIDAIINLNPSNMPPTAHANGPYQGNEGSAIIFTALGSSDPEQAPLRYRWDFDGDGTWDTAASSDPVASFAFTDDFNGSARVAVTDGCQVRFATALVEVRNVPPTPAMTLVNGAPIVLTNVPASFTGTWTDPGLDSFVVATAWAGASPLVTGIASAVPPVSDTRTYTDAGDYTVTFTVTDDDGGQGQVSSVLRVRTPAGATEAIANQLRALAANPLVASAIANLVGNNDGRANNGALDKFAKGNVNAAFNPPERAVSDLLTAHGANPQLALLDEIALLTDIARSAAIQAIADAEKAGKKNNASKLAEARALVAQGLALQQAGQFLPAVQKYQLAQRAV